MEYNSVENAFGESWNMGKIERVGISLEQELLAKFDALIESRGIRTAPRPCAT